MDIDVPSHQKQQHAADSHRRLSGPVMEHAALLHPNQVENAAGEGGTFVLTCPLTVQMVTGIQGDRDNDHGQGSGEVGVGRYITIHRCGEIVPMTIHCREYPPIRLTR
jgi:hypothetical protein